MAATKKTGQRLEDELAALAELAQAPRATALRGLERALRERAAAVAAAAATMAHELGFTELNPALVVAFERFREDGIKRDPGCRAKEASIEALDRLDANVPEVFIAATRYVQREPHWGEPIDTATGIRARAIHALARWGDRDTPLLAGKLLTDPEWPVRQAAAEALGVYNDRGTSAALLVAMAREDEVSVLTACMQSLLRVVPDFALPELASSLSRPGERRESALLVLARSGREDALRLLLDQIDSEIMAPRREEAIRVLGLHRSEPALVAILGFVAEGPLATSKAAAAALEARRFDPGVRARALAAARKNGTRAIAALVAQVFEDVSR